jgi:hypothetical protein
VIARAAVGGTASEKWLAGGQYDAVAECVISAMEPEPNMRGRRFMVGFILTINRDRNTQELSIIRNNVIWRVARP